ncbi:MAG TPA: VOC family protein [Burkholderiales bacterium]|nr:VOC family protein [Burkholderiales bacterium]
MAQQSISLGHVGLYVTDIDRMVDFYTSVLGFVVSDRGEARGSQFAFLTRDPNHHHQVVMVTGRPSDLAFNVVQQVSFKVDSLRTLKNRYERLLAAGVTGIDPITHGNAISAYFRDPEGNRTELFIDTPWYVYQPHAAAVDLSRPETDIMREVERHARKQPGFKPWAEWRAEIEKKLAAAA